jgi:hypothetical protein
VFLLLLLGWRGAYDCVLLKLVASVLSPLAFIVFRWMEAFPLYLRSLFN